MNPLLWLLKRRRRSVLRELRESFHAIGIDLDDTSDADVETAVRAFTMALREEYPTEEHVVAVLERIAAKAKPRRDENAA